VSKPGLREKIVEAVRDPARQSAQRFHLLRLPKLFLKLLSFRIVPLQRVAHALKGLRYLGELTASSRF
jgi:hypothetical protein